MVPPAAPAKPPAGAGRPQARGNAQNAVVVGAGSPRPSRLLVGTQRAAVAARPRQGAGGRTAPARTAAGSPVPPVAVQRHRPQPLAPEGGHEEGVAGDRGPAGRRLGGGPGDQRVAEPRVAARCPRPPASRSWPPVSIRLTSSTRCSARTRWRTSGPASSQASPCTLRWPSCHTGDAGNGLSAGTPPSGCIRRILPPRLAGSWAPAPLGGVAGPGVQHPVGPEGDPPAVVDAGLGDARRPAPRRLPAAEPEAHDPVVGGGGEVGVDELVAVEGGRDGEAEQPALAARRPPRARSRPPGALARAGPGGCGRCRARRPARCRRAGRPGPRAPPARRPPPRAPRTRPRSPVPRRGRPPPARARPHTRPAPGRRPGAPRPGQGGTSPAHAGRRPLKRA